MTDPFSTIRPFNLDSIDPMDMAELQQPWESTYTEGVYGRPMDLDGSVRTIQPITRTIDAAPIQSMAHAIGTLPSPQESVHLWIGGKHSLGHLIPAVLELAAPAVIEECSIATLTFSRQNAEEWADLIDKGQLAKVTIITSVYFEKTSAHIFDHAKSILEPRGVKIITLRCHCKLACLKLSDGRTITGESSANTRSAKTLEFLTLFGSPAVYRFHTAQLARGESMKGHEYGLSK